MARKRELTIEELKRKPILTTTDIGRLAGCTRQTAHNWAVKEKIRGKRVKRYKGQYRFPNTAKLLAYCEKEKRRLDARPARQGPRPAFSRDFPFINDFWKWDQAVKNGQAAPPQIDRLRHQLEPAVRLMVKHCGADWVMGLIVKRRGARLGT